MVPLMKQKLLCEKYLNEKQDYSSTWIVKAKHRVALASHLNLRMSTELSQNL